VPEFLSTRVYEVCDELDETLSTRVYLDEENKPGLRLVINAGMNVMADQRRYDASVLNEWMCSF